MRIFLTIFLFLFLEPAFAQNFPIKYYDSSWRPVLKETAFYSKEITKEGDKYKAVYYWARSGQVKSIGFYKDSSLYLRAAGLEKGYYENGQLKDSSTYDNDGVTIIGSQYYYADGKKWTDYLYDPVTKKSITNAWDSAGNLIKNFIYLREAEYPEGEEEWRSFLGRKLKPNVPVKKGAPNGSYHVMIRFVVDKDGSLVDIRPETNFGYGMEEEGMRVIAKSKKWIPAIFLNKPAKAYRRQPLTFVVQ